MFNSQLFLASRYRWLVACTGLITNILNCGYAFATMAVLPLHLQRQYGERTLSANIGTVQAALCFMGVLPGNLIRQKIGERRTQAIAAVFTVVGLTSTAFSREPWQGMLASGVLYGTGAALNHVVSYSMNNIYFPSHQLPLSIAMMVSFNIAEIGWPPVVDSMMQNLDFKMTFISLGALNTLNFVAALIYTPEYASNTDVTNQNTTDTQKKELSLKGQKAGIYHLQRFGGNMLHHKNKTDEPEGKISDYIFEDKEMKKEQSERKDTELREVIRIVRQSSRISQVFLVGSSDIGIDEDDLEKKFNEETKSTKSSKTDNSLLPIFKTKGMLTYLLVALLTTGGFACFCAILGDYTYHNLGFTLTEFSFGIILKGVAQLIVTIGLTLLTNYFLVSSSVIYCVGQMGMLSAVGLMLVKPSTEVFYVIMLICGIFKGLQLSSFFGVCLELTSPEQSITAYSIELFFDGIGALTLPYLAIEAQVNWNINAGLYLSMGIFGLGIVFMVHLICTRLTSAKVYKPDTAKDVIRSTSIDWLNKT
ncbi:uncharacterized protein [Watersipora subatra]|uniref:uncharacterized protein isoform X1 n=2 Tax=Watersipora subatra TaxID=2589382 RepID=UPI00355B443E